MGKKHILYLVLMATLLSRLVTPAISQVIPGATRMEKYIPLLKDKRVGVFANQTSMVGKTHLVDTLVSLGIKITVIFGPEHGFRGKADAGEKVGNTIDEKTGIPVISLYGAKRRPDKKDLEEVDIMLFDIQDVGVRYYTFISSLEEYIASAMEFQKPIILLDRPNPNGHYVDGPVLDTRYRSFVGRQPIPIVYGLTIGEYACMLLGEHWIKKPEGQSSETLPTVASAALMEESSEKKRNGDDDEQSNHQSWLISDRDDLRRLSENEFKLLVITCQGYDHLSKYAPPVRPSPNLPNIQSIYLYPFTCLFEGTVLSEGRGTDKPFQVFGHPNLPKTLFSFTPQPNEGAKSSKHYGKKCYGWDLSGSPDKVYATANKRVQLKWLIQAYNQFPQKDSFFLLPKSGKMEESFFTKLSGNNELWQQIRNGMTEEQIRKTWEPALNDYKTIRKKYLLYKDFE